VYTECCLPVDRRPRLQAAEDAVLAAVARDAAAEGRPAAAAWQTAADALAAGAAANSIASAKEAYRAAPAQVALPHCAVDSVLWSQPLLIRAHSGPTVCPAAHVHAHTCITR
jgi:hypothetical protein